MSTNDDITIMNEVNAADKEKERKEQEEREKVGRHSN